jgi:hypothetical protein
MSDELPHHQTGLGIAVFSGMLPALSLAPGNNFPGRCPAFASGFACLHGMAGFRLAKQRETP